MDIVFLLHLWSVNSLKHVYCFFCWFHSRKQQLEPTLNWPSDKGFAVVTSATRIQLILGGTIYNAWVSGKRVKPRKTTT